MLTKLTKPITRETVRLEIRGRPIVVTLCPGDVLEFHEKGKRQRYTIGLEACFWLAVKRNVHNARSLDARQLPSDYFG